MSRITTRTTSSWGKTGFPWTQRCLTTPGRHVRHNSRQGSMNVDTTMAIADTLSWTRRRFASTSRPTADGMAALSSRTTWTSLRGGQKGTREWWCGDHFPQHQQRRWSVPLHEGSCGGVVADLDNRHHPHAGEDAGPGSHAVAGRLLWGWALCAGYETKTQEPVAYKPLHACLVVTHSNRTACAPVGCAALKIDCLLC